MPRKAAIITGASSGIGRASAVELSHAGWAVVLVARNQRALTDTVLSCSTSVDVAVEPGDVTNEDFVLGVFSRTIGRFGRLDLLFNNAGVSAPQVPLEDISLASFQSVINTNLTGSFLFTREAFKVFKSQTPQGGRIINNGSLSAHVPRPNSLAYAASKHAITGLSRATALDGRPFNIACTQLDIGNAATALSLSQSMDVNEQHSLTAAPRTDTPRTKALQASGDVKEEPTFDAQHVARAVVHIAALPLEVTVLEMTIMATGMPYVGRG